MTADVKSCQQILEVFIMFFTLVQWKSRRQPEATVDPAAIRGLGTTGRAAVGCLPLSRLECP
jgi:hypothetical protein